LAKTEDFVETFWSLELFFRTRQNYSKLLCCHITMDMRFIWSRFSCHGYDQANACHIFRATDSQNTTDNILVNGSCGWHASYDWHCLVQK